MKDETKFRILGKKQYISVKLSMHCLSKITTAPDQLCINITCKCCVEMPLDYHVTLLCTLLYSWKALPEHDLSKYNRKYNVVFCSLFIH